MFSCTQLYIVCNFGTTHPTIRNKTHKSREEDSLEKAKTHATRHTFSFRPGAVKGTCTYVVQGGLTFQTTLGASACCQSERTSVFAQYKSHDTVWLLVQSMMPEVHAVV